MPALKPDAAGAEELGGRAPRASVLSGWLSRCLGRHDRGAVGVMVAILLAGGVLLGFATLTVDVGVLYTERQQLQSAADAAALGLANACARGRVDCDPVNGTGQLAFAAGFANANVDDNAADVFYVCGDDPKGWLDPCDGHEPNNLTRCVGNRPSHNFVEVHVRTLTADGGTFLPPVFAQTLVGAPNTGTTVGACARASWSTDSVVRVAAFAISICAYSGSNTQTAWVDPRQRHRSNFETTNANVARNGTLDELRHECLGPPPDDWEQPPDFAWLAPRGGKCEADIVERRVGDNGIADWPAVCRDFIRSVQPETDPLTRVVVPVIDGMRTSGGAIEYHVSRYVSLTVVGYRYDNVDLAASWLPPDSGTPYVAFPYMDRRYISTVLHLKAETNPPSGTTSVIGSIRLTG